MTLKIDPEQEMVIKKGVNHILHNKKQVYQFAGKAGTGKTFVLREILRQSKIPMTRVAPMAYMGQAASVLRSRGLTGARTIHSWKYRLIEEEAKDENGNIIMDLVFNKPKIILKFVPNDLSDIDLIIVDEGYTVPYHMKKDIEREGIPIIVCGDQNQLPPVKDKPAYLVDGDIDYLTTLHRQNESDAIAYIADRILNDLPIHCGLYGNVLVIEQKDLTVDMIIKSNILLCGTNRTRDYYNNYIRHNILHIDNDLPIIGERVICRKNNWMQEVDGISLTNGLTGIVTNPPSIDTYNNDLFYMDFKPFLLNNSFNNLACDYKYYKANYQNRQLIKNSPYSKGEKFEFAYASTTHLSQGSQYPCGIYIREFMPKDIQKALDYTAVTRFKGFLIFVVPNKKGFW